MMVDVMPGHTEYGILAHLGMILAASDSQVRPTMVFADKRLPGLPNVPTANEMGFGGTYTNNWFALWTRQDTNPESIAKMSTLTRQTARSNLQEFQGITLINAELKESTEYVAKEIKIFERIADKIKR
jgi:tripartite-type tricarboxylate transporter receptor subunit TctC